MGRVFYSNLLVSALYWEIQTINIIEAVFIFIILLHNLSFFNLLLVNSGMFFVPFFRLKYFFSSILCRADLAIFNHFSLSFSWRVFVPPSILIDSFDGHSSLGSQTQTLPNLKVFFPGPCGLKGFCWVTRCWSNRSAFISDLTFLSSLQLSKSFLCSVLLKL